MPQENEVEMYNDDLAVAYRASQQCDGCELPWKESWLSKYEEAGGTEVGS